MTSRAVLESMLRELEDDMPRLLQDMSAFCKAFEGRSEIILDVTDARDLEFVYDSLIDILRRNEVGQFEYRSIPRLH